MNNELQELTQAAVDHFGSQEQGEAFVDGFLKSAHSINDVFEAVSKINPSVPKGFGNSIKEGLATNIGKGIGVGVTGLAFAGLAGAIGHLASQSEKAKLHVKFQAALTQVKSTNRIVKSADANKVNSYSETIFRFAPHVSTDPNLLGSLLANFIQGESIDPMSIKMLTELEGRYADNSKFQFTKV